eukprot:2297322-Pleurochrysis_carterae.AAC.1
MVHDVVELHAVWDWKAFFEPHTERLGGFCTGQLGGRGCMSFTVARTHTAMCGCGCAKHPNLQIGCLRAQVIASSSLCQRGNLHLQGQSLMCAGLAC